MKTGCVRWASLHDLPRSYFFDPYTKEGMLMTLNDTKGFGPLQQLYDAEWALRGFRRAP